MPKYTKADKAEAVERLRKYLKPAPFTRRSNGTRDYSAERQTVYTLVRSVSRSGMNRVISTYVADPEDGDLVCLDWAIAVACGYPLAKDQGVKIGGCGMNMCFALLDHATTAAFGHGAESPNGNDYRMRDL